jgi:hypothetical protein
MVIYSSAFREYANIYFSKFSDKQSYPTPFQIPIANGKYLYQGQQSQVYFNLKSLVNTHLHMLESFVTQNKSSFGLFPGLKEETLKIA